MNRLVVFIKAPEPGAAKSRLASVLGAEVAADLSKALAVDSYRVALTAGAPVTIAYAPSPSFPDPSWLWETAPGSVWFRQEGAGLGERLAAAFHLAFNEGAGRVIVIGADLPGLSAPALRHAFQALERCEAVAGPALDGGYYLLGLTRPMPFLFENVPWSTEHVWPVTGDRLRQHGVAAAELSTLRDLDTPEDLAWFLEAGIDRLTFPQTAVLLDGIRVSR